MADNVIRLAPSRTFLIHQAVLNAALKHYPWGVHHYSTGHVLRKIQDAGAVGFFAEEVIEQFRELAGNYGPSLDHEFEPFAEGLFHS